MRVRLNLDARRSFRPSASLFSTWSAASKTDSSKPVRVTKRAYGLTPSRPSVTRGRRGDSRPYRTHYRRLAALCPCRRAQSRSCSPTWRARPPLWEERPELMRVALARHDALLRQAVGAQGGHVVKTTGDGLHAVFARAPDALAAALAAQRALTAEAWELPRPLRARMGLHSGSAEERDGDYYGPAVNRAARVMQAGHDGQVLLSESRPGWSAVACPRAQACGNWASTACRTCSSPSTCSSWSRPTYRTGSRHSGRSAREGTTCRSKSRASWAASAS
jgi:Adenylate and Guanylate cyclase catalytic domain